MNSSKENNSIIRIVKESISFTLKNILPFLKFWILPFIASTLFYVLITGLQGVISSYISLGWVFSAFVSILVGVFSTVCASFWIPKWIKFYVHKKESVKLFSFDKDNINYLKKSLLFLFGLGGIFLFLILLSNLIQSFSPTFGMFFSFFFVAVAVYLFYRFSFVLPAAALGDDLTFMDSWHQSRGYSWKFFGLIISLTFLINIPIIVMGLFAVLFNQIHTGMGVLGPFIFLGTIIVLLTNIIFFGAFTIAWTNFYKIIRKK
jgi:hypothetical protein